MLELSQDRRPAGMRSVKNIRRDEAQNYCTRTVATQQLGSGSFVPYWERTVLELAVQALFGQTRGVRAAYDIDCGTNTNGIVSRGVFKKSV